MQWLWLHCPPPKKKTEIPKDLVLRSLGAKLSLLAPRSEPRLRSLNASSSLRRWRSRFKPMTSALSLDGGAPPRLVLPASSNPRRRLEVGGRPRLNLLPVLNILSPPRLLPDLKPDITINQYCWTFRG